MPLFDLYPRKRYPAVKAWLILQLISLLLHFKWISIQNYTIFPWKSINVELKPQINQHRNIEKALGKTLRHLEKKQKSKTHAWKGSYIVLG